MPDQWLKALSYLAGGRKVTFGAIIGGFFGACLYALFPGVVGQLGNRDAIVNNLFDLIQPSANVPNCSNGIRDG